MISHQFNLTFSKSWSEAKGITYHVSTEDARWTELAIHLENSSFENTVSQIEVLNQKSDIKRIAKQWREVSGSKSLIYLKNSTIKIGNSTISVDELKHILQDWLTHIQPFSVENETTKVSKYLMLPITKITFDDRFPLNEPYVDDNWDFIKLRAKLYSQNQYIGEIPYMISHFGPMYDTSERELINWEGLTELFRQELFAVILKQEPAAVALESSRYGTLLVKDGNGKTLNLAHCQYIDSQWRVILTDLGSVVKSKSISVVLKVPPPLIL